MSNAHPSNTGPNLPGLVKTTDPGQGLKFILFNKLPGDAAVMVHGLSWTSRAQEHSKSLVCTEHHIENSTPGIFLGCRNKLLAGLDGVESRGTAVWCQPRMDSCPYLPEYRKPYSLELSIIVL